MDSPLLKLPNTFRAFYGAFQSLFPFQVKTIDPILQDRDLILQSGTGSGKTEGVLAPCLERVIMSGGRNRLLYVVPTRALAFDLKRRLAPIITPRLGLGLGVRTGDIKRRGGRTPHLMITTPESLDVLLGSRNPDLRECVSFIRMVIIDEVHPLVHQYRGRQLALVLQRLRRRTGRSLQKIALSATIGDLEAIERFFDFRDSSVRIVDDVRKGIRPHLVHLKNETDELVALFDDLYHAYNYRKILLFANSRNTCDRLFALLGAQGSFSGACGLHYSNLKPERRRDVEHHFRQNPHALCVATSTLELGIDVGDVDAVVLYEPPDSVSAFLQRIGRASRGREKTVFWGICRGPRAGEQLTRFLGLLTLAEQGMVEKPLPKKLYSVLCQQTVSCIYEKQRISSGAMKDLFPEESRALDAILNTMDKKGWLSRGPVQGLFQGGWQYTSALLEHGIWSNFPPAEDEYALVLDNRTIADIPRALVAQLEPGDRVNLAGKGLLITEIVHSPGAGRVLALPSTQRDAKELFWLGPGQQVSYETAQAVREVVKGSIDKETGLFVRTRTLLEKEREKFRNAATLKNGLEVLLAPAGLFRYLTYLGSVGNLILCWSMRDHLNLSEAEDVYVAFDAVGVDCSHLIDFSRLPLPLSRDELTRWTRQHFKLLQASFPLNRFCSTLPNDLHLSEMADFLFDERIMEAFSRYQEQSSDILTGSLDFLEKGEQDTSSPAERIPAVGRPLLDLEKTHQGPLSHTGLDYPGLSNRPLTGSILAGYFRHFQCERFVRFHFLPEHLQPASRLRSDHQKQREERLQQGSRFEETVMLHLQRMGATVVSIPERDGQGNLRPFKRRYRETIDAIQSILSLPENESNGPRYLSQGVLFDKGLLRNVEGLGIPDLIRVSREQKNPVLMVGDIKSSPEPRFDQQWQVAFYAYLLEKMTASLEMEETVTISKRGFLLLPAQESVNVAEQHEFDLSPFFTAFPVLLQNLKAVLLNNAREAAFHLMSHCTACPWFDYCYYQALDHEDIRFLPNLSPGQLDHLHSLGLNTLNKAEQWLESSSIEAMPGPTSARKKLKAKIEALTTHAFLPKSTLTRLYPANISASILLLAVPGRKAREVHIGLWFADDPEGTQPRIWEIQPGSNHEKSKWLDFMNVFSARLAGAVQADRGPHVFSFGSWTPRKLLAWAKELGTSSEYEMIQDMIHNHWTDLARVFKTHFSLPVPGELTLHDLCHVLDVASVIKRPHSLLHPDRQHADLTDALAVLESLRKWLLARLQSSRRQDGWKTESEKEEPSKRHVQFLKEQQQLRQEDLASVQACTLKERVECFRALGPLRFTGKELDSEGRFQYNFSLAQDSGPGKFREGDFLKLAHAGTRHLQDGFSVILTRFDPSCHSLSLSSRQGPLALNRRISYSLEEDAEDWSTPKLIHGITTVLNPPLHPVSRLLQGRYQEAQATGSSSWIRKWLDHNQQTAGLNTAQRKAMELAFDKGLGPIDGPPGT
ncbi:MAG: DEAD/DEAH box helicase, partial [Desulfohalobiaceae bacterium]|nr:DEAD/DEAH box helicase [Desulfohalobiaceae bacterium]